MRKLFIFTVLAIFFTGWCAAQLSSSLPVMLAVKAIQKTDGKPSQAILDDGEHFIMVDANTLEDVLQTLYNNKLIKYFPDQVYTEQIRGMNTHIAGKKIFETSVFVVPQTFEKKAVKRYGFNFGANNPYEVDQAEGAEHLQALLAAYASLEQWEARKQMLRENILRQIQLDPMPRKNPLNPIYGKTRHYKGYSVTNIALETVPGYWLCGSLYRPANSKGKTPVMLSPHGHFGSGGENVMNERGRFRPDMQYRCAMLARMGIAVFSYDMFAYGGESSLQIPYEAHRTPLAHTMQLWNSIRVTDFLCSLDYVDQTKIGITGASGGGTQSFLLAAVDPRITFSVPAVMVSAHFYGGCPCESGWPIHQTHSGLHTNNVEIAAMIAPKPQLLISIGTDWSKNTPVTELPYLRKMYGLYNQAGNVENVHIPNEEHDYGYTKREALYNFVTRVCGIDTKIFKDAQGRFIEKDVTIEAPDKLLVFGNGSIPDKLYILQPAKTRPMMPATNIHSADGLNKALRKLQNLD